MQNLPRGQMFGAGMISINLNEGVRNMCFFGFEKVLFGHLLDSKECFRGVGMAFEGCFFEPSFEKAHMTVSYRFEDNPTKFDFSKQPL